MRIEPLHPGDWTGSFTEKRKQSPFRTTWSYTVELLNREIRKLDGSNVVIQLAVTRDQIRVDGTMPLANARPEHPGVILAFNSKYGPLRYMADTFYHWQDNVRAIALGLESLRRVDRYGITRDGQQYKGWRALPAEASTSPLDVINEWSGLDAGNAIQDRVRSALKRSHPDSPTGSHEAFIAVQRAADQLKAGGV